MGKMEQILKLSEIMPYENNARKNDKAVKDVAESIKQCGYIAPIIVDENNVILAGHTRYKALKKLGYKEVTVRKVTGLTEEQKRKYRLLDNKTNELAEWDFEKLKDEIDGLDFSEFDIDWGLSCDDFINDLLQNKFEGMPSESDSFQVSFLFQKKDKEIIDNYFSTYGKENLANKILEIIKETINA